ncbi:AlbA family DNA-binding domain-containing protein [Cohnella silvisoli]|uniref:ATP-binding protein n=1 Tax=Cohnella silvisoli TaxID=2873699 RepID=A0ABV1L1I4_9BACL|nr:ATP-binding protein [Cohnella silvisoli]MCD9025439.1 ATP-binding protein [Cohnella silvisoli]
MKVKKILSNLNAWKLLDSVYKQEIYEVIYSIENLNTSNNKLIRDISKSFVNVLRKLNWEDYCPTSSKGPWHFDCIKNKVGIEFCLAKQAFLESKLFLKAPAAYKYDLFDIAVFVIPINRDALKFDGLTTFDKILNVFNDLSPIQLQYPFIILGIGNEENDDHMLEIIELTTDLDAFLIGYTENSLETLIATGEKINYDFKVELPENKKIAQEICAFANMEGGGFLILGVTNSGQVVGINNNELDSAQQRIVNVVRDSCDPPPKIDFFIFNHNLKGRSIMIVTVKEMGNKPCMTQDRIYIRVGSTVRIAKPDEVRRLILM